MSSAARPRGPLPARVYWVRRALVFGTAFLLIFGLARLLGSGSDGDGEGAKPTAEQAAAQQTDEASSQTSGPTDESSPDSSTEASKPKKTKTPLAQPSGPCDPTEVTVSPEVDTVAWSDQIKVPLFLSGQDEACTFEVSSKSLAIKITSGSDLIWTSQQCGRIPAEDVVVRSESRTKVVFVWNGRRSADDCDRTAVYVQPGWYHVEVAAFGGEPTSDKFELTGPKPEKVYKTVKPKPNKKSDKDKKKADDKSEKRTKKPSSSETRSGSTEPNG